MDSKPSASLSSDKIESNGVNSVVDNNNNLKSVVVSSDDETEGFASGEEEAFETVIDNNNKDLETLANVDEGEETFSEPSEFPLPKTEADDEVNDAEKVKLGIGSEGDKAGENTSVVENGVKVTEEGDSVVEEVKVETPAPGVVVVVANTDEDEDVLLVGGSDEGDSAAVNNTDEETPNFESVDAKDVKVATEGESYAAVVAKTVEEKPELRTADAEDVKVTTEGDSDVAVVGKVDVEKPELASVEAEDVKVTPEVDSVVDDAVDVDLPLPGVAAVAVVTKVEEDGADVAETDKLSSVLEEVVDKEVVGVTDSKFAPLAVEDVEKEVDYSGQETEPVVVKTALNDVEDVSVVGLEGDADKSTEVLTKDKPEDADNGIENRPADKFVLEESDGSHSDESSEAAKQFIEELEGDGGSNTDGESSLDRSQMDGQIVTDSEEEDDEEDGKELFDSAALAALLKAAADGSSEGGNITFSSEDGSRLFTVERPAGLGSSLQAMRAAPRPPRANIFNPTSLMSAGETEPNLTEEERTKLEKLQAIRMKFLRLVQRLGLSPDESVAAQVLYRLALIVGRQTGQAFSLDAAKRKASELEAAAGDTELDFSVNILVIGKAGVGKSATINSIFGEEKTPVGAFHTATGTVKEITGVVGGVTVRVLDTPGLRTSVMEQGYNRSVLASAKRFTKKNPPDIVLYVDRLDAQTRDHNDIPLLKTITSSLGSAIWRSAIVTFTHGASAPPEGSNGTPLSYEMFVTQRSHVVQQAIGQAVGDLRMMSPGLMNPVSLVENHQSCRKNREDQKVLPNGQTWRPQLLMLCYSMKILSEANALTKPQDPFDSRKLFGFRVRAPPLPYMLSSMLQSRAHPKLSADQGGDAGDSDVDLAELTDSDREEDEDEYDQLPPFKPLKRSQLAKLSKEQKKAYYDEYDYRVKLLQKKQWKEEVKRMKEMKKKGPDGLTGQTYQEEEGEGDAPAPIAVPLPDMALPPSFDSDNPAYRFRFLEPTSQFLARPVLDTHGWDHDCGYDGVNVEQTLAIANRFPAVISVQVTKDKKDFSINMDSSVSAKYGENVSTMAGFDIQPIGKQLAYIVRGETKFKNLKKNKTAAGVSVTFLGENIVTGFKVEDQIALGRQYAIIGSAGTVWFQTDSAYGANIEVQRRELDYPIGQIQSTIGLSIIKWRGDLALGLNSLAQFSAGRNSKVTLRAGLNNKMSGQITVKTSSSEYLSLALAAVIPSVISAYKKLRSAGGDGDKYSPY
ncbi:translocase of chloroplast 159, chloroplastic-like isoform X2 [Bidens hawaiensis]|uniref:translocase of chloroplast 159, chloroplastic-like isoform X2 n=1 Tax=Bidens hawaiensis TaxID=980011 RepID=UPI00404A30E8